MSAPSETGRQDTLTAGQRKVLAGALADAVTHREPSGSCADCAVHPAALCEPHAEDLDARDSYLGLARELGIEVDR